MTTVTHKEYNLPESTRLGVGDDGLIHFVNIFDEAWCQEFMLDDEEFAIIETVPDVNPSDGICDNCADAALEES